jgi:hypothetical protein
MPDGLANEIDAVVEEMFATGNRSSESGDYPRVSFVGGFISDPPPRGRLILFVRM